ncbi:MAG: trimethylamine methyltransferase family protein [bacterium]
MPKSFFLPYLKSEKIHDASLRVLEETGVKLQQEEALDLMLSAGARKDSEGRVLIPATMVGEALEKGRRRGGLKLYDQEGKRPIELRVGKTHYGPGGDALYNVDLETREKRRSVLSDVTNNVRIADALPNFDFIMSMALPEELDSDKLYPNVFAEMTKNTAKPIVATFVSLEDMKHIHNIAAIVAGSKKKLLKKPFYIAHLDPISPLIMDDNSVSKLLFAAENNIPVLYAAAANCGGSAPITPLGGVVQGSAESLAGLVLATLKNEHVQFIYGSNTSSMDMKSTIVCYGDPTWFRTTAMYADMGRFYNLPSWGTAGSSDSFQVDAQAAMEAYEGISLGLMAGTTMAHDVGLLAHGELYDPRMLILTDMMIGRARQILRPADLSEDALAIHVIDEVARSGDVFLAHPHTAKKFREALWLPPRYINRKHISYDQEQPIEDMLFQEVVSTLESHQPSLLSTEKEKKVNQYLDSI